MRDQRGFMVVELLLAIIIIGIGLVGLAEVIPFAFESIQYGNQTTQATTLAEQRMEQVITAPWNTTGVDCLGVSAGPDAAPSGMSVGCVAFDDETSLPSPYVAYGRQVRVTSCAAGACFPGSDGSIRSVLVRVFYFSTIGNSGAGKSIEHVSYIAKR